MATNETQSESLAEIAAAKRLAEDTGQASRDLQQAFGDFAEKGREYYAKTFLRIQQAKLSFFHFNIFAMLGGFVWARR